MRIRIKVIATEKEITNKNRRIDFTRLETFFRERLGFPIEEDGCLIPAEKTESVTVYFEGDKEVEGSFFDVPATFDKFKEYDEKCAEVKALEAKNLLLSGDAGKWAGQVGELQAKYDKCISTIKKFDPGIIGMYDL